MRIANLIEAGACLVNGAVGRAGYRVLKGDSIEVSINAGAPTAMSPEAIPLEIIHEDVEVIVLVKPAGMLVHPTMSVRTGTLANALAYHLNKSRIDGGGWTIEDLAVSPSEPPDPRSSVLNPQPVIRPGMVHRLDRATSGLMVIAKTPRGLSVLSRHFRKRLVKKRYLALVRGNLEKETGSIDAPIGRDPDLRPHWRVMESGKVAETRFRVIERMGTVTLLELEPVTGRTNQLRIHSAHIRHPIIGDEMYGDCDSGKRNQQSTTLNEQSDTRLCLHACSLAFHHPANGEWIEFTSPLPTDVAETIGRYRVR